jgi:acetylglutamate kinase
MEYKKYMSFEDIDKSKFCDLVISSFGKKLVSDYFDVTIPKYICIAQDNEEYLGGIVVLPFNKDIVYLDKIMVDLNYVHNGVGKNLWTILNGDSNKILWRAKSTNPINNFYEKQCTGLHKIDEWIIYWKGLNLVELSEGIDFAINKKVTLENIFEHLDSKTI